jgi:ankyrin repeat protein
MKKILIAMFALSALAAKAQQNTLLSPAFWQGKPDVAAIKAEIDKGNNPSQFNAMSFDPVVMAINADASSQAIFYLLSQPGNEVGKITHDSRNYLHWAAIKGNTEVMQYLLSKGAKTDNEDSHGTVPMLFAAGGGQQNTKVYELLIAGGANLKKSVNGDGANALLVSIANDPEMLLTNYFVAKGLDLNSTDAAGNNAFSYAARSGNIELLKKLLQKGIKPMPNAMLMAAQGSRRGSTKLEVYQYLESLGLKPTITNQKGENVLHSIVRKPKQEEIIAYFLARGADINQVDEEGNTVFMNAAAANRDTAVFALLLARTKDINRVKKNGFSALTLAVRSNSPEVVNYLISKGAQVKVLDKKGNNLAYYAVDSYRSPRPGGFGGPGGQTGAGAGQRNLNGPKEDDLSIKMKSLQQAGLDMIAPQENGNSLYHIAVAKNDLNLLKRLQPLGIDINAKNKDGITALHKAALTAKDDTVLKYLLSIGANKEATTSFEETAFDLAAENESLTKNNISVTFLK